MHAFRSGLAGLGLAGLSLVMLAACQSSGTETAGAAAGAKGTAAPVAAAAAESAAAVNAYAPAQCAIAIAGGPPPPPSKGTDFGSATAKNLGKNVSRNLIANIGGRVAGPIGGAVAGGIAVDAIRSEQDLKGNWTATDGSGTCGCPIAISSGVNLQGRTVYSGKLTPRGCNSPYLAQATRWALGHTFTGYGASFELKAANGATLATLKRDGMDYFSGTLGDGTPVILWRQ